MGTKSLPGQRHPNGILGVDSAFFGPLPFRGDGLETKKPSWELGLRVVQVSAVSDPLFNFGFNQSDCSKFKEHFSSTAFGPNFTKSAI